MVLVFGNDIGGNKEYGAALVAQTVRSKWWASGFMAWLFIESVLPPVFGYEGMMVDISMIDIAHSVLIYLGIPF